MCVCVCVCVLQAGGGGVGAARVSRATLHISVESSNLHAPSLSVRHLPSVTEQGAVGTVYAIVTAHDRDRGRAGLLDTVSVVEGDPDGQFAVRRGVDADEGEYTLEVVRSLDREQHRDGFNLTLAAVDRGRPPRTGTAQVPDGWLCGVALDKVKKVARTQLPRLIPVLGSQPAGDVSHKPDGRLPLLSARPAVTPATLKRAATNFAAW